MTALFTAVVEMSLKAVPVICVLLFLRLLLKKAPKKYSYALWSVAAFRLLCPVSISSVFSLFNFRLDKVPSLDVPVNTAPTMPAPSIDSGATIMPSSGPVTNLVPDVEVQQIIVKPEVQVTAIDWTMVFSVIWLLGVLVVASYTMWRYWRIYRRTDGAVKESDRVWLCDNIPGPFVFGLFRPRIFIPVWLGEEERRYVLAHERYHIRRYDPWAKMLGQIVLAIHWFNPLVWFALWALDRDMELSCDEGALRSFDEDERKNYSRTLLALGTGRKEFGPVLAFGTPAVKRRITNVLNFKRATKITVIFSFVILLIAGLTCCTDAKGEDSYAKKLYEAKTQYVGDNSAVVNLIDVALEETSLVRGVVELDTGFEPYGMTVQISAEKWGAKEKSESYRLAGLMILLVDNLDWCEVKITCPDGSVTLFLNEEEVELYLGLDDLKSYSREVSGIETILERIDQLDTTRMPFHEKDGEPVYQVVDSEVSVYSFVVPEEEFYQPYVALYKDGSYHLNASPLSSQFHTGYYSVEGNVITLTSAGNEDRYLFRIVEQGVLEFIAEGSTELERFAGETSLGDRSRLYYDVLLSKYGTDAKWLSFWDDFENSESYRALYDAVVWRQFGEFDLQLQANKVVVNGVLPNTTTVKAALDQIYRSGVMLLALAEDIDAVIQQYSDGSRVAADMLERREVEADLGVSLTGYRENPEKLKELALLIEDYLSNRQIPASVVTAYYRMVGAELDDITIYTPDVGLNSDGTCFISYAENSAIGFYANAGDELCYYDTENGKTYYFRWIDEYSFVLQEKNSAGRVSDVIEMSQPNDFRSAQPVAGTVFSKAVYYDGDWCYLRDVAEDGVNYEVNNGYYRVLGYDAEYLEYSERNGVYFVSPRFADPWFSERTVEGDVEWADESKNAVRIGFTLETIGGDGTVSGPSINFVVMVSDGILLNCEITPDDSGRGIDMSEEAMVSAALRLEEVLRDAQRYATLCGNG